MLQRRMHHSMWPISSQCSILLNSGPRSQRRPVAKNLQSWTWCCTNQQPHTIPSLLTAFSILSLLLLTLGGCIWYFICWNWYLVWCWCCTNSFTLSQPCLQPSWSASWPWDGLFVMWNGVFGIWWFVGILQVEICIWCWCGKRYLTRCHPWLLPSPPHDLMTYTYLLLA